MKIVTRAYVADLDLFFLSNCLELSAERSINDAVVISYFIIFKVDIITQTALYLEFFSCYSVNSH